LVDLKYQKIGTCFFYKTAIAYKRTSLSLAG